MTTKQQIENLEKRLEEINEIRTDLKEEERRVKKVITALEKLEEFDDDGHQEPEKEEEFINAWTTAESEE